MVPILSGCHIYQTDICLPISLQLGLGKQGEVTTEAGPLLPRVTISQGTVIPETVVQHSHRSDPGRTERNSYRRFFHRLICAGQRGFRASGNSKADYLKSYPRSPAGGG